MNDQTVVSRASGLACDGMIVHLNQRDVSLAAVWRAPIDKLAAFKKAAWGRTSDGFRLAPMVSAPEAPGSSVFFKHRKGVVLHTYACYARGLDI